MVEGESHSHSTYGMDNPYHRIFNGAIWKQRADIAEERSSNPEHCDSRIGVVQFAVSGTDKNKVDTCIMMSTEVMG